MIEWVYGSYIGAFFILFGYLLNETYHLKKLKKDAQRN